MIDGSVPDRLAQLRSRWEADPASRVFLQLAEEYRHQGRLQEALGVLDAGLKEHPGYLSALVAKGRCLLELGQPEPAREVLERVVRQDATQMVANKLLVRAYLDTGQAARARERLDLYSLLHDGDPEVGDLRGRIDRLDGRSGDGAARPPTTMANIEPTSAADDVFDLGAAAPAAPRPEAQDVFDLPLAPPPRAAEPAAAELPAPPAPSAAEAAAPAVSAPSEDEPEPVAEGEPFAGLVSRAVRRRYLEGLTAEGIFAFLLPAEPPSAPAPPPERIAADLAPPHAAGEPWPAEAPFELASAPAPLLAAPAPEPVSPELLPEPAPALSTLLAPAPSPPLDTPLSPGGFETGEAAAPPAAEEAGWPAGTEVATATLGELYLRQGHASEAERIFDEVLRREPDNAAAHQGLARARALGPAAPAAEAVVPLDRRARKIHLLNGYLDRIRRGSGRHVS